MTEPMTHLKERLAEIYDLQRAFMVRAGTARR